MRVKHSLMAAGALLLSAFMAAGADIIEFTAVRKNPTTADLVWRNTSDQSYLLFMGGIHENTIFPLIQAELVRPESKTTLDFYASGLGSQDVVEGRIDPWVIILAPRTAFSLQVTLRGFVSKSMRTNKQLGDWTKEKDWKLSIKWMGTPGMTMHREESAFRIASPKTGRTRFHSG